MRFHQHDSWVTCSLRFNDRWNEQWLAHGFTWLYFYDEAVSFAAGHRPCAEWRRADYKRYQGAWAHAFGGQPPSWRPARSTDWSSRSCASSRMARAFGTCRVAVRADAALTVVDSTISATFTVAAGEVAGFAMLRAARAARCSRADAPGRSRRTDR